MTIAFAIIPKFKRACPLRPGILKCEAGRRCVPNASMTPGCAFSKRQRRSGSSIGFCIMPLAEIGRGTTSERGRMNNGRRTSGLRGFGRSSPTSMALPPDTSNCSSTVKAGLRSSISDFSLRSSVEASALEEAWRMDATRVWVHTCSLDHPGALKNYEARGMRLYHTERKP